MSPLNRGPLLGPRMPPTGIRPPLPRFGRLPMPGMPLRMPPPSIPPMGGMFGPMRQRMPLPPPRPTGMMRLGGGPPAPPPPPPLFGPRVPPPLLMRPMLGPRGMGPRGPPIRPGPRGIMPAQGMPHMRSRFPPGNGTIKGKGINNAKKVNKLEEIELKKPWMTDEIRSEIQKKNKLYAKAKKNKDAKEWEEFKDLRNKVTRMIRDAKNEYLAKHPDQASVYQDEPDYCDTRDKDNESNDEDEIYYCEICDRDFSTEKLLNDHKSSHRVCGIDGCTFSAHPKIVEKHITMQHSTGLYERMRNLSTPEDIKNWVAERKRKYPTKMNIDQKQAESSEKKKRGEIIEQTKGKGNTLDKKKAGHAKKRRKQKRKNYEIKLLDAENDKNEENSLGIAMFKGTKLLLDHSDEKAASKSPQFSQLLEDREDDLPIECSDDEDERISTSQIKTSNLQTKVNTSPEVLNTGLAATTALSLTLVADYDSDLEDEPPEEVPIKRIKLDAPEIPDITEVSSVEQPKSEKKIAKKEVKQKTINKAPMLIDKPIYQKKRNMLLQRLLSRSIQHERNYICQSVKYIFDNNFFDTKS